MRATPNAAELAFASWQATEERAHQRNVLLARQYHEGIHDTRLTERMRLFLNTNDDHEFNLNVVRPVVQAVEERLLITGVDTNEPQAPDGTPKPQAAWASSLLDGVAQMAVHEGTPRDGEFFLLVDWDDASGAVRLLPHHRYIDPAVGGDGFGCKVHYPGNNEYLPPVYASKRWTERLEQGRARQRVTLYYPDRIEKYEITAGGLAPFQDPDDEGWPLPWVQRNGKPLGIPVIHFRNTIDARPEAWDGIPVQRAINKLIIDLLAAGDMTAFRIFAAFGWMPTTDGKKPAADGSNALNLQPGEIVGSTASPRDANLTAINGAPLDQFLNVIQTQIMWLAAVTGTPLSRFAIMRQAISGDSQREHNEALFAKVRKRQKLMTSPWMETLSLARRMTNTFGTGSLDESIRFTLNWEPAQARDTADERGEWTTKASLGVPLPVLWAEMGYSQAQIAKFTNATEETALGVRGQ